MKLWFGSAEDRMRSLNSPPEGTWTALQVPLQCPCSLWQVIPATSPAAQFQRQFRTSLACQALLLDYFSWDFPPGIPCPCTFLLIFYSWVCFHPSACPALGLLCGCHMFCTQCWELFIFFSLGTCCDSSSISKSMQSKICQEEIFL